MSLLPDNLSELEHDLDSALNRLSEISIPISTLWNPNTCPESVLPYLAWALSVDQWESSWTIEVKRRVVASSLNVHRIKGTRPAVEKALADLGVKVEFKEWFESSPSGTPGTFELTAWAHENLTAEKGYLNQALYDQLKTAVDNAKNTRSHYTMRVGARLDNQDTRIATAVNAMGVCRLPVEAQQAPLELSKEFIYGTAVTGVQVIRKRVFADESCICLPQMRFGAKVGVMAYQVIRKHFKVPADEQDKP